MTNSEAVANNAMSSESVAQFFDDFIATLKADQVQLEIGIANKEKQAFYDMLISGNTLKLAQYGVNASALIIIKAMVSAFIHYSEEFNVNYNKLAFDWSLNKLRVWAEIKMDDEESEKGIVLAEAKVNAALKNSGFYVSTMIVEDCDKISIPSHYQEYITK